MTDATVRLWGRDIGAVSWLPDRNIGVFQYMPDFAASGIELAPIMMPLGTNPYEFPGLPRPAFKGLPGLLADSLPDKFGNALIDAWLVAQGRAADSFNPVERLCYIGTRGMGALEFHPAILKGARTSKRLEIDALTRLANQVLNNRTNLAGVLSGDDDSETLQEILRVGTSAGGARAKAIVAYNHDTGEVRSGQVDGLPGFTYCLIKFDGVTNKALGDPMGYGRIEYAYHLMAVASGISMMPCTLLEEHGRAHFLTQRFDRVRDDRGTVHKLHMATLCGMAHMDYNQPLVHSYEQAFQVMRLLGLPYPDAAELFRRACFNVIAWNCDDHTKNTSFLMDPQGDWHLAPAYDMTYAYNPESLWLRQHQMSLNGKRDHFETADLVAFGGFCGLKPKKAESIIRDMHAHVENWPSFADQAGVPKAEAVKIHRAMRREMVIPAARS